MCHFIRPAIQITLGPIWRAKPARRALLVHTSFVVSLDFFSQNTGFVDPAVPVLDVSLKKWPLNVESLLYRLLFAADLDGLYFFTNQFHRMVPPEWFVMFHIQVPQNHLHNQRQEQSNFPPLLA